MVPLRVKVVGGGVTAAAFCQRLLELVPSVDIVVSEMGKGTGGRCSTRKCNKTDIEYLHGCPAFDVRSTEFQTIVKQWTQQNIVQKWDPLRLGVINMDSLMDVHHVPSQQHTLYQPSPSFCANLMSERTTFQPNTLIRTMALTEEKKWQINDDTSVLHDWLVVTSPVVGHSSRWSKNFGSIGTELPPLVKALSAKNKNSQTQTERLLLDAMSELKSRSILSLITIFSGTLAQQCAKQFPFDMAHIQNSSVVGKIVCPSQGLTDDGLYPMITHSTAEYSSSIGNVRGTGSSISTVGTKGVPSSVEKQTMVEATMRKELIRCLAPWMKDLLSFDDATREVNISNSTVHQWGAAFPERHPYFEDKLSLLVPESNLAVCGDYFSQQPGRIETAVLSGRDSAEKLAETLLVRI
jgi:predicted NAD/FAD-dependent oxidoreductase